MQGCSCQGGKSHQCLRGKTPPQGSSGTGATSRTRTSTSTTTSTGTTRPVGKKTGWQVARVHLNWRRLVTKIAEITHSREKAIFQQTVKKGLSHKTEWIEIDCDDVPDPANKRNRDRASGSNG